MRRAHRSIVVAALSVRAASILALVALVVEAAPAAAIGVIIPIGDLNPFGAPCSLSLGENGQSRMLGWSPVAGAAFYRVGYVAGTEVVGLAELPGTSFEHIGWAANECLEYVVVAYDSGGVKVCSAHVPRVGKCQ
jgi:hypothetical protein